MVRPIPGEYFDPHREVTEVEAPSPEQAIVKAFSSMSRGSRFAEVSAERIVDDRYEVRIIVG